MTSRQEVDYRELMKKVERLVDALDRTDDVEATVHTLADGVIAHFRDELGIYGGRQYSRVDGDYELRKVFGAAKAVAPGLRVPRSYPPISRCLAEGAVYIEPSDPGFDPAVEARLGVREFAGIEVGDQAYILAFDVAPGVDGDDVVYSLQILRHAINNRIRQERMVSVFREARRIQTSILPAGPPLFPPYEFAGRTAPVDSVGGDFYDWIPITDKVLGVAIADVSGHGLPAALQVRDIHMGLRMGMARDFKIVRTVERLNEIIHQSTLTSRFVALFYGELEPNGNFIYVNAGHVAPFLLRAGGEAQLLEEGGAVLGPLADATYERGFVVLAPGDLLVLFTDGIVETHRPGRVDEEMGVERIAEVARRARGGGAGAVVDAIFEAAQAFGEGAPAEDDRTVVVVRRP